MDQKSFLSTNQQRHSTEENTKHWPQPAAWPHPFFIRPPPDSWRIREGLTDWVKVLHTTQHKTGHFRDVLPSQSLGIVLKKLNLTQQKQTTEEQNSLSWTRKTHKMLYPNECTKTKPKPKPTLSFNNCSCVCISLCTTVVHNTAQNSSDNFPSCSPDNAHYSDDIYWRGGGWTPELEDWLLPLHSVSDANTNQLTNININAKNAAPINKWHVMFRNDSKNIKHLISTDTCEYDTACAVCELRTKLKMMQSEAHH